MMMMMRSDFYLTFIWLIKVFLRRIILCSDRFWGTVFYFNHFSGKKLLEEEIKQSIKLQKYAKFALILSGGAEYFVDVT